MTLLEKLLAFKTTPPFDRLNDNELALIASTSQERQYLPGEIIHPGVEPFPRFYLLVSGGWQCGTVPLERTLGVGSLLYDLPAPGPVLATNEGAVCLQIARRHFHTIANECPELLLGYLSDDAAPAAPTP
jgi:signal-transduction protein with cAMP-binding, CBS, and nucleotidyltransferase domain